MARARKDLDLLAMTRDTGTCEILTYLLRFGRVVPGRAKGIQHKMVGMAEAGVPISQDGVAVHLDYWCICLCYLHFAPENPEDGKQR